MAKEMMMEAPEAEMPESEVEVAATAEVPVSLLGGAAVGDSVSLTVDAIDEETGMATLSAGASVSPEADGSAIGGAAELFNE